jgi:hypothetical protein
MVQADYKPKVDAQFERRAEEEDIPPEHLKVCNYLAKKLFLQENEETRDRLKKTISLMRR